MKGLVIATLVIVSILLILAVDWFIYWVGYASTLVDYISSLKENPRYITIDDNDALKEEHDRISND